MTESMLAIEVLSALRCSYAEVSLPILVGAGEHRFASTE